ncbi:hypothetical protein [Nocardia sp. NPDC046763]|uniref:hypothetical protein n=1 Tax=Nocardia sp. NPDC046763 TaxID=3155256 RepID=UPI0033E9F419
MKAIAFRMAPVRSIAFVAVAAAVSAAPFISTASALADITVETPRSQDSVSEELTGPAQINDEEPTGRAWSHTRSNEENGPGDIGWPGYPAYSGYPGWDCHRHPPYPPYPPYPPFPPPSGSASGSGLSGSASGSGM